MTPADLAVEAALEESRRLELGGLEVLIKGGQSLSIKVFEGKVDSFSTSDTRSLSIRALRDDLEGYAYTEDLSPEAVASTVRVAAENALLVAQPEPVAVGNFPGPISELKLYCPELAEIPVEEKVKWAIDTEAAALAVSSEVQAVPYVGYSEGSGFMRIANHLGMDRSYLDGGAYLYAYPLCVREEDKKMALDFLRTRDGTGLDPQAVGEGAVARARALLGATEIEGGTYPILLENRLATDFLSAFADIFSAQSAQDGSSVLGQDRLGTIIGSDQVNLVDDPLLENGWGSRPFDDEGCPSRPLLLVEKGRFLSYLHNTKTARRAGTKTTGHGGRSTKGTLSIGVSNFFLKPGARSVEELRAAHSRLIEVVEIQGLHSGADSSSGDFSLPCKGFWVEAGERLRPIHNFTVSGNILDLLSRVEGVADDLEFGLSGIGSPSFLVSGLSVGGK